MERQRVMGVTVIVFGGPRTHRAGSLIFTLIYIYIRVAFPCWTDGMRAAAASLITERAL